MNRIDLVLIILSILEGLVLFVIARFAKEYKDCRWKALYIIPSLVMFIFLGIGGFEPYMIGVYVGCFLPLGGFFVQKEMVQKMTSIAMVIITTISLIICSFIPAYRCPNYEKEFELVFSQMKEHYCLTEYKKIDFDALHEKYLSKMQKATAEHDRVKGIKAMQEFAGEFYDGHVYYACADEKWADKTAESVFGNDYGLSLMQLADGKFVAVNVSDDLELKEGTTVLLWDGKSPESYFEQIGLFYDMNMPDQENADFYLPMYVAGIGGNEVIITYLDEAGNEKETVLQKRGFYHERLEQTLDTIDQGRNIGHLEFDRLDDNTVLFRLKQMAYDTDTYESDDYSEMEGQIIRAIDSYKSDGVKDIIIDLRENGGGSPYMVMAIAKLFDSEGEHFYLSAGTVDKSTGNYVYDDSSKKYQIGDSLTYYGQNLWDQGNIVVLVNGRCISAGDHLAYLFNQMENATVMGFTKSNGSGQAVQNVQLESGMFSYSAIPTMNEDGTIFMDSSTDMKSQSQVDIKIPFDENAVKALFEKEEDYVLDFARKWLENGLDKYQGG